MLGSTFPFYIHSIGGDDASAGLATGIFSVSSVLLRPIAGWILDNKGRRLILLAGMIGVIIFPLSYAACTMLFLVFALRLMHGVFWACTTTSTMTIVSDMIPRKRFAEGMGYFGTTSSLAVAFAPSIGLLTMELYGFSHMFILSSVMVFFAFLVALWLPVKPLPADKPKKDLSHSMKTLINKNAIPASFSLLIFLFPYGAITTFIAIFADTNGLPSGGIFFAIMALTTAASRLVIGKIVDQKGEAGIVYACTILMFVGLWSLAFLPTTAMYCLAALCIGASFGCMTPALQAVAMRIAPPEERGSASSTFLCAFDVGIGIGGIVSGFLARQFGYQTMFFLMSAFLIVSIATYLLWVRNHPSSFGYEKRMQKLQQKKAVQQ